MADKMRWRYGNTSPVMCAVDSAVVVEIGDLLYLDTDDVKPATSQTDAGSEAANQTVFANKFMGVAMQRSRSGDTAPIRVATKGVFEYPCPSGTFEVGDLVGPDENAGGDGLLDQQVTAVASYEYAIGRVYRRQATARTSILVELLSTIMHGGVQGTSGT